MSEQPSKKTTGRIRLEPSAEFDKALSQLVGSESVKEVQRIIKSPDPQTKYTYEVQVDPATGKQNVIESFTTTKKECALCGNYSVQVFHCEDCGAQVCANDARHHTWSYPVDQYGRPAFDTDKDNRTVDFVNKEKMLCKICYESKHKSEE